MDASAARDAPVPTDEGADGAGDAFPVADGIDVSAACAGAPVAHVLVAEGDCVPPGLLVHLDGTRSLTADGGPVARYRWRVEAPTGVVPRFVPNAEFHSPTYEVHAGGTYSFSLDVWDDEGRQSCAPATAEVVVACCGGIEIELRWHTPGDPDETDTGPGAGSDLDLHFMHPLAPSDSNAADHDGDGAPDPYFDQQLACWWWNPQPRWAVGWFRYGDPRLDRNDEDGAGPETVFVEWPELEGSYRIAVHAWDDHGYGPSAATVRVRVFAQLVYERTATLESGDLWCVGFIEWPGGAVRPCEAPGGGAPRITPDYPLPSWMTGNDQER